MLHRFKPPPPNSRIGWRVEFRPTECQLTDFENAALTVFVVMLTRVILSYNLNILIPISKVEENIKRAQKRDALLNQSYMNVYIDVPFCYIVYSLGISTFNN